MMLLRTRALGLVWLLCLAGTILLAGCSTQSVRRPPVTTAPSQPLDSAADASGAELMQQAASASGARAAALYLSAGEAYMRQADWNGVEAALASVMGANERADLFLRYAALQAGLALHQGDARGANEWLANREPALAAFGSADPGADTVRVLQAAICAALDDYVCAANSLMQLTRPEALANVPTFTEASLHSRTPASAAEPVDLMGTPGPDPRSRFGSSASASKVAAAQLHDRIWHYLSQAPASEASAQAAAAANRTAQGWWDLHRAAASGDSLAAQQTRLAQWQRRYPSHSAQFPWPTALAAVQQATTRITEVAVLLPLSGSLAAAGSAVQNGLIASQLTDPEPLNLRFYDVAAEPIPTLYERALTNGAQVLLGPLAKANVDTLTSLQPAVPMLALNYLNEGDAIPANLLQIGLAVEDEADTLARALAAAQHERVLIIHSEAAWSRRAANRLAERVQGNATIESFADAKTVTEAVGRGMLVEDSQRRSQQVYRQIGTHIEFTPRARTDLDAIVALVNNTEAKVLVPALQFHFGKHLPVYVTGQATRGAQADDLRSLTGFQVTELPWFIEGDALAQEVTEAFRLGGNNLAALYALGSDAYRIADRLPLLSRHTDLVFAGNSGALSVSPDGRFRRELSWGVISNSRLLPMPRVSSR